MILAVYLFKNATVHGKSEHFVTLVERKKRLTFIRKVVGLHAGTVASDLSEIFGRENNNIGIFAKICRTYCLLLAFSHHVFQVVLLTFLVRRECNYNDHEVTYLLVCVIFFHKNIELRGYFE